jgi:hypothetical protein
MLRIHSNARTTPAVRAEIARSTGPTGGSHRRAGPAPLGEHQDHPQVAQARAGGLPRPLPQAPQAALEGHRGGARAARAPCT